MNQSRLERARDFRRWLAFVLRYRIRLGAALIALAIGLAVESLVPGVVGFVIDRMLSGSALATQMVALPTLGLVALKPAFLVVLATVLALLVVRGVCHYLRGKWLADVGEQVHVDIRSALFDHIQRLPMTYFDESSTGRIMSRITSDTDALFHLLVNGVTDVLGQALLVTVVTVVLFTMNAGLTLVCVLSVPVLWLLIRHVRRHAMSAGEAQRESIGGLFARLQERLAGIRLSRMLNRRGTESREFQDDLLALCQHNRVLSHSYVALGAISELLTRAVAMVILCLGGWAVAAGQLSVGELVAFFLYAGLLLGPIGLMVRTWTEHSANGSVSMRRVFTVLDMPIADELVGQHPSCPPLRGQIRFEHVSFAYRNGSAVLSDMDVEISAGALIGVVGTSGAGKSTLASLLCRLYRPTSGRIIIDGIDLSQVDAGSYRDQISYLSQDGFLFSGSVEDNLRLGRADASQDDLESAARQAGAHEFITTMPLGYATTIGERGVLLSGGQRQRLNLARALLRKPAILILDEPTSALDADSENVVMNVLHQQFHGTTRIVIAHRLSTIKHADRILVLDQGRIVQQGTHHDLLALGGRYRHWCERQGLNVSSLALPDPAALQRSVA